MHKENFTSNPKFRLINPTKSELGKVSKVILNDINDKIRSAIGVNQWKNFYSVVDWFQLIGNKQNRTFLSFDIVDLSQASQQIMWVAHVTSLHTLYK